MASPTSELIETVQKLSERVQSLRGMLAYVRDVIKTGDMAKIYAEVAAIDRALELTARPV